MTTHTQDNYNNTYKTITTIHKRQRTTIHTKHLKIQHVQKVNNTKVRSKQHEGNNTKVITGTNMKTDNHLQGQSKKKPNLFHLNSLLYLQLNQTCLLQSTPL